MASLLIATGSQAGDYYPLAERPLSCGRDPSQDIQLRDPKVSRRHFLIRFADGAYTVRELKSKNGVLLNGQRVREAELHDGDEIHVGDTTLIFCTADRPDRPNALFTLHDASRPFREGKTETG